MKKTRCLISLMVACVLFCTACGAAAAPEYAVDIDLVEGPNIDIILQAADVQRNDETGEITFRSVSNSFRADTNTYVIDANTTFSIEQDREALEHFVSGEYPFIGVEYPKELYWELGETDFQEIHVINVSTILKDLVIYPGGDTLSSTSTPLSVTDFIDIPSSSPYAPALYRLKNLGIVDGYPDGSFQPENPITRAEMVKLLLGLSNAQDSQITQEPELPFSDVDSSHWAYHQIYTAQQLGYVDGNGDGTFAPDAPVTNEEALKLIVCALGYETAAEENGGYPTGYLVIATDLALTKGISGGILGTDPAPRGNIAVYLDHALDTPLMKYLEDGENSRYVISDGEQAALETLATKYFAQ